MSWLAEKAIANADAGVCYDWAVDPDQVLENPKGLGGTFCHVSYSRSDTTTGQATGQDSLQEEPTSTAQLHKSSRQVNVHIALEEPNQRGNQNKVYRYDSLAAQQDFAGAVISEDEGLLDALRPLLQGDLRLGSARSAGYGWLHIEEPRLEPAWNEYEAGGDPKDGSLVVTLLSDAILRGGKGHEDCHVDEALAEALGLQGSAWLRKYRRVHLVGGYNRKWSLPLTQSWALEAGSVYVCVPGKAAPSSLRTAAALGVGDRRAEGFGRVAVNWHTSPQVQYQRVYSERRAQATTLLSESSKKVAQDMAQRQLRLLLERKLAEAISQTECTGPLPARTQLSRLRAVLQRAQQQSSATPITQHLDNLRDARHQFERTSLQDTSLLEWIRARANSLDVQQQLLRGQALPVVAGIAADLSRELRVEYTARYIDGVFKKMIQQSQTLDKKTQEVAQ
jgi:CRISPR-associated protein Csx10